MSVFVDTSVWFSALNENDARHADARRMLEGAEGLVTSDHIVVETWLLTNARGGHAVADRFWEGLRRGIARVEHATASDLEVAWHIGERFADQGFSIVDRTSFAMMMRLGITHAASFDADFSVFRYGPKNRHAFDILR